MGRVHLNHLLLLKKSILSYFVTAVLTGVTCVVCAVQSPVFFFFLCDAVVRITDMCENIPHCFCASPRASYAGAISALFS